MVYILTSPSWFPNWNQPIRYIRLKSPKKDEREKQVLVFNSPNGKIWIFTLVGGKVKRESLLPTTKKEILDFLGKQKNFRNQTLDLLSLIDAEIQELHDSRKIPYNPESSWSKAYLDANPPPQKKSSSSPRKKITKRK